MPNSEMMKFTQRKGGILVCGCDPPTQLTIDAAMGVAGTPFTKAL